MVNDCSLDSSYLSADKWIAVDVFGVKCHERRWREIRNRLGSGSVFLGLFWFFFCICVKIQ